MRFMVSKTVWVVHFRYLNENWKLLRYITSKIKMINVVGINDFVKLNYIIAKLHTTDSSVYVTRRVKRSLNVA